jgi:hypothetical protein
MNAELSKLITVLEENSVTAREKFGALTNEQLNWKPAPDKWSVGQCFDHLFVAHHGMLAKFEETVEGKHKTTLFERLPLLPKLFGGFLVKAIMPDNPKKMKNPGIFDPSQSTVDPEIVEKFLADQEKIAAVMRSSKNIDLEKTIMTSPVASFIIYSMLNGYRVVAHHGTRHLQQAEQVMQTEGFPK